MNNALMNVGVQISLWDPYFNFLGYIPRSGIVGSYGSSIFNFWGTAILFSIVALPMYIPTVHESSLFSTSLPTFVISRIFGNSRIFWQVWGDISLVFWFAFLWWLVMLSTSSYNYWPSECLLWKNVYSGPLPILKLDFFFLLLIELCEFLIYFGY